MGGMQQDGSAGKSTCSSCTGTLVQKQMCCTSVIPAFLWWNGRWGKENSPKAQEPASLKYAKTQRVHALARWREKTELQKLSSDRYTWAMQELFRGVVFNLISKCLKMFLVSHTARFQFSWLQCWRLLLLVWIFLFLLSSAMFCFMCFEDLGTDIDRCAVSIFNPS